MDQLAGMMQELHTKLLLVTLHPPPAIPRLTPSHFQNPTSLTPESFSGEIVKCVGFLLQSSLVFNRSLQCLNL